MSSIIILNIFYFLLLFSMVWKWFKNIIAEPKTIRTFLTKDFALLMILIGIGTIPVWILNHSTLNISTSVGVEPIVQWWLSLLLALLISGVWMMYIRKIDIYEQEKWKHVVATFILGAAFTFVALIGYRFVEGLFWNLNGNPLNDLIYCIVAIGGIEETVKIIPFLIILLFTNAADEPYDYILYPSISALGFAFVENVMYINESGLYNIGGRAVYATVAHMFFSSLVGYGMLLSKYHYKNRSRIVSFVIYFFLAMLAHGFYDFWLINGWVSKFSFLTTIFFLITIHIWFILKNNALNISTYFDEKLNLDNDQLRWYLVISLSSLLMLGYVIVSIIYGLDNGWQYLVNSWLAYSYLVLYLSLSFSRYKIKRGFVDKLKVPFDFFIPKPVIK